MGNEEDWKKLQQWQEEQTKKQEADLNRRRHASKGLKEQTREEKQDKMTLVAKFVHFSKSLGEVMLMNKDEVKLSIVVVFICIVLFIWNRAVVPNQERTVKEEYGQTDYYCVAEQEIATKTKLYTYTTKKYPDLYFHVKLERGNLYEDIKPSMLKYFYERTEHPLKDKFTVEMDEEGGLLKKYRLCYIFHGLDEVEDAVDAVYNFRKVFEEQLGNYDQIYTKSDNDIYLTLFYDPNLNLEQSKEEGKRQYVSILQERINNKRAEGKSLTEEEKDEALTDEIIKKYCRLNLAISINGEPIMKEGWTEPEPVKAYYSYGIYRYDLGKEMLEKIPGITYPEEQKYYSGSFIYNGIEYVDNSSKTEKDLRDIFGATFEYDYANEKVNIVIK